MIADTVHGSIVLTEFEKKIMSHVAFNRLHDVYQNSTVYLTFPCNRTKRFEHSLGTMKICSDIFSFAVKNSEQNVVKEFFRKFRQEIVDIIKNVKNSKYKEYEGNFGGRVKKITEAVPDLTGEEDTNIIGAVKIEKDYEATYYILLESIRIAALLHDIGHPPYSHITEVALKTVLEKYKERGDNDYQKEFNDIMSSFYADGNNKKLHERMGDRIVGIILSDSIDLIPQSIADSKADKNLEIFKGQILRVTIKETVQRILSNKGMFAILHRIVDGTLDGDRLDYVTRDSINSGLNRGKIEYDRLCNGMVIGKRDNEFWICPNVKTLNTVEDYLNRRWEIYKNIIYHHRVIKTDYLLQSVIENICGIYLEGKISGEAPDERTTDLLPADISGLWKALKTSTNIDCSYAISQWDDSWLMTVLKKHYFKDFINEDEQYPILSKQLAELLTNKKYYFSVIKRLEDFQIIDSKIADILNNRSMEINCLIDRLEKLSKKEKCAEKSLINSQDNSDSNNINIDAFIDNIRKALTFAKLINQKTVFQGLLFSQLKKVRVNMEESLSDFLKSVVNEAKERSFPTGSIEDLFCIVKDYDLGTKKPLFLYNQNNKQVFSIHEISSISKILSMSYDTFPQFFIYILKTEECRDKILNIRKFLEQIGILIAEKFLDNWTNMLNTNINQLEKEG